MKEIKEMTHEEVREALKCLAVRPQMVMLGINAAALAATEDALWERWEETKPAQAAKKSRRLVFSGTGQGLIYL